MRSCIVSTSRPCELFSSCSCWPNSLHSRCAVPSALESLPMCCVDAALLALASRSVVSAKVRAAS